MSAVAVHTSRVSTYTENDCARPCWAGCSTSVAADTMAPVPCPASLEKIPRLTPMAMVEPRIPLQMGLRPNAPLKMALKTAGTSWICIPTTTSDSTM